MRGLPNTDPSRFIMKAIVTREPAAIGVRERHAPNCRRRSMSVLAGRASCATARFAMIMAGIAARGAKRAARPAFRHSPLAIPRLSPEEFLAPREAFRRPQRLRIVIGLACRNVRGQGDPGQLGARVDVDVGGKPERLVERADAHETQGLAAAVMAPDGDLARRAAMDDM